MSAPDASANDVQRLDTTTRQRLYGPWLAVARAVWGLLIALTLLVFALAVFDQITGLSNLTADDLLFGSQLDAPPRLLATYLLTVDSVSALVFFAVGLVLLWRRSDNWHAMLVSVMLVTFGGIVINGTANSLLDTRPALRPLFAFLGAVGQGTFVAFLYSLPDGRFVPRWTALLALAGIVWFTLLAVTFVYPLIPLALPDWAIFGASFAVYGGSVLVHRRHRNQERLGTAQWQQMKWIIGGLSAALAGYVVWVLPRLLFPALANPAEATTLIVVLLSHLFLVVSLTLVPVAIAFSILRYRLWEVDFVINRGLVYGALTGALLIVTVVNLFGLQRIFLALTNQQQAPMALAVAALVSGGVFRPVRRRLQSFVDKRFYGIQLDYQQRTPAPTVSNGDLDGTTVGPYEIMEPIGRGGMAEVYKGRHPTLNRTVAVKMMRADRAHEADFRIRFEREAQAIALLRHPSIVEIYDFGAVENTYYMVMEYIDGSSLSDYIQQNGRLPLELGLALIGDVASALDYAHEQGLVHRDVKPSNVMLQLATTPTPGGAQYQAILTDFGIAKMRGGATALTQTGMVGTLDYIAPEQISDAKDVDGRADVYSLGAMAYEMLTGQLPFPGSNPGAVLIAHLHQPAPDPRTQQPDLPQAVAKAIGRALAKEREDRYSTAGGFAAAMR